MGIIQNTLDTLLFGYRWILYGLAEIPQRGIIQFLGDGVSIADDPVNKRTVISFEASATNDYVNERLHSSEQILFAGIDDANSIAPHVLGARLVNCPVNQPWATSAEFLAGFVKNGGTGPVHVDLYDVTNDVILAVLSTSTTSAVVELTADVSTLIGAPPASVTVRSYADIDTLVNSLFDYLNLHVVKTTGTVHSNADSADLVSAMVYPPAVDLPTRIARINAICDAYELHRVKDTGSSPAIHINSGGDTTNALAITTPAVTDSDVRTRATDLQSAFNAHVEDVTSHTIADSADHVPVAGTVGSFYAAIRYS